METKETILATMKAKGIQSDVLRLWEETFNNIPEEEQRTILDVILRDSTMISILTENMLVKYAALEANDLSRWVTALKQDEKIAQNL